MISTSIVSLTVCQHHDNKSKFKLFCKSCKTICLLVLLTSLQTAAVASPPAGQFEKEPPWRMANRKAENKTTFMINPYLKLHCCVQCKKTKTNKKS